MPYSDPKKQRAALKEIDKRLGNVRLTLNIKDSTRDQWFSLKNGSNLSANDLLLKLMEKNNS